MAGLIYSILNCKSLSEEIRVKVPEICPKTILEKHNIEVSMNDNEEEGWKMINTLGDVIDAIFGVLDTCDPSFRNFTNRMYALLLEKLVPGL